MESKVKPPEQMHKFLQEAFHVRDQAWFLFVGKSGRPYVRAKFKTGKADELRREVRGCSLRTAIKLAGQLASSN